MIDIKNYIRTQIQKDAPTLDTAPGSVINDALIEPLTPILQPYHVAHEQLITYLGMSNPDEIPESFLDAAGFMLALLERNPGEKAVGSVYLYFTEPKSISIPNGTYFESQGSIFESSSNYSIAMSQMRYNLSDLPYYTAGPIEVVALEPGEGYNLSANSLFTCQATLSATPTKIQNKTDFISGTEKESNSAFVERLKHAIYGKSLASPINIESLLTEEFPSIKDVEIIGANHDLMVRDLMYDKLDVANYSEEDFYLVYSGMHSGLYDKKHIAYIGNFVDTDESEEIAFPSIASWADEFSDDMYKGLYKFDDLNYTESDDFIIISEFFDEVYNIQPDLALILTSGNWFLHDGANTNNLLYYIDEFGIEGGKLRLGKYMNRDVLPINVTIPYDELQSIYDRLERIHEHRENGESFTDIVETINTYLGDEKINNVSPIIHKQISQHTGIRITCEMSTTDNTEDGEMAYITVLRNNYQFAPHDGYGLAWRKQPAYLLRMQANNYGTNVAQKAADLAKFYYEYNVAGDPYLGQIKNNSQFWKYNIYLVDNDTLQEEVWIGHDQLMDQSSGRNQFLQAGKAWIEPDISYRFRIDIYEHFGTKAWIHDINETFNENTHLIINRGETYPPYMPQSGNKIEIGSGPDILTYYRNHFGVAVGQTRNCEWYLSDLLVKSFIEMFPMHLFKFYIELEDFNFDNPAAIKYYGIGYDPIQSVLLPETGHAKVMMAVYNTSSLAWETLGIHTTGIPLEYGEELVYEDILISGQVSVLRNYIDADGYVNIAATAANSGTDFPNDTRHALRSYYVQINNLEVDGVHRGNAIDVYCHDPNNILVGHAIATASGNSVILSNVVGVNQYIQEILEVRDYISQIPYDSSSYIIMNLDKGNTYSKDNNFKIIFDDDNMDGAMIDILYRYWSKGTLVDNMVSNSRHRYPSADLKAKIVPTATVNISQLQYAGGLPLEDMKLKIVEFFNSLEDTTFDKSDLVDLLYDNDATYVNLEMAVTIREYDTVYKRTITEMATQSYTISVSNIARFYTTISELSGVERL